MALDFAQVDPAGEVTGVTVRIGVDMHHSLIQAAPAARYPLLARMHDYYEDVAYRDEELEALQLELQQYGDTLSEPEHVATVAQMRELVLSCIESGLRVEAIAD